MAAWTQSLFLQALGWAILNSLWQMALLWFLFSSLNHVFSLSSAYKYRLSAGALLLGFAWFVGTFINYYVYPSTGNSLFHYANIPSGGLLPVLLLSASVAYLLLLVIPALRLFRNWQYVQQIKTTGQTRAHADHRLFVQKIAFLLGISKKVKLAVSTLVSSPVTVGYLKPVILLPVAAMNQLTIAQVEAVLLHELSHIRRCDYMMNFILSVIQALLYYNPFVRLFMTTVEAEREACCDEVVLQFGYDKADYAAALLHLEKATSRYGTLALAAAGRQNLLTRIEKIAGLEKKKTFRLAQAIPLCLALLCVLLFNSVLIFEDAQKGESLSTATPTIVLSPWQFNNSQQPVLTGEPVHKENPMTPAPSARIPVSSTSVTISINNYAPLPAITEAAPPENNHFIPVAFDDVDGRLTKEEKNTVKSTLEATKKVAGTLQWKEIEKNIGDAMSRREKEIARQEYLQELDKVSWSAIEENMKANYNKLNWQVIQQDVNTALLKVQLDSLQDVYSQALILLNKTEKNLQSKAPAALNPLPDASVEQIQVAKEAVQKTIERLKVAGEKKIIRL